MQANENICSAHDFSPGGSCKQCCEGKRQRPADIIENGSDQDRIASAIESEVRLGYDLGALLVDFGAEIAVYPEDSRFNRYAFGPSIRGDFPLANKGAMRLRLGAEYQYVLGDDGRVFDRPRAEAQIIHRHSREHTTTGRLRYGFRNQSEDRFTGFDQSEWLAELRHNWRPDGGPTSINMSLLGMKHDADDGRFSYTGYGFRLVGSTPLADKLTGVARIRIYGLPPVSTIRSGIRFRYLARRDMSATRPMCRFGTLTVLSAG